MLSKEQIEKIKIVRKMGNSELKIASGFSFQSAKRALEETDWKVEDALALIYKTNEFGKMIIKG